jgi:hypothetical protein
MINKKTTTNFKYAIGIDCGVNTGFAVWSVEGQCFRCVKTLKIHKALAEVASAFKNEKNIKVFIEDARLRKWFGTNSTAKLQGAGSVKRDCKIWEDFCIDLGIPYYLVAPKDNMTKLDSEQFIKFTKWEGSTNEHSRDAGMMVFKRDR